MLVKHYAPNHMLAPITLSVWSLLGVIKSNSHLHHVPKLYTCYHDPSPSDSPDTLFTWLLYYTKGQSCKKEIIQSNIYRILPKVNQVIYTLDTICQQNILILAQALLQIFCSQGSTSLQSKSWKRGITLKWQVRRKRKKYGYSLFFMLYIPNIKFQDPISNCCLMQCYGCTRTDRPKPICPLNYFEVKGIKILVVKFYYLRILWQ